MDARHVGQALTGAAVKLSRQVMHDLLWSVPAIHVATALRISSGSLAKSCERRGIPTPPRGYWQRSGSGYPMPPIPPLSAVEYELPLPWESTPELELLLQTIKSHGSPSSAMATDDSEAVERQLTGAPGAQVGRSGSSHPEVSVPLSDPCVSEPPDVARVEPEDAIDMAMLARDISACERLCREVLRVAKRQPLPVGEVMEAWVATVLRRCRERDPIAALVERCTTIAQTRLPVPWNESGGSETRRA